jgi:hypothetical protein
MKISILQIAINAFSHPEVVKFIKRLQKLHIYPYRK